MSVFIAHAEADQAAAEDLKGFLQSRGLVVETETGARGFRHLQVSDVVIALWSQKSVFGAHRMMMEKRMLDAWADGRLVLVKLDHGFLPVGMRDLTWIDASFESGRKLGVWPQVERAAKAATNVAMVESESPQPPRPAGGPGAPPTARARAQEPSRLEVPAASKRGGGAMMGFVAVAAVVGISTWALITNPDAVVRLPPVIAAIGVGGSELELPVFWLAIAAIGCVAVLVLAITVLAMLARGGRRRLAAHKSSAARGSTLGKVAQADEAVSEGAMPAHAPPSPVPADAVFISYAHADNSQVDPVVKVVQASGHAVWIDKGGIQAGEGWAGEIVRGIKGATRVMVMCSPNAFESDHIKREVYLADRYKKPMLPVFIAEAQPPEDFEYFFAGVQWLELFKLSEADRPAAIGKALATA